MKKLLGFFVIILLMISLSSCSNRSYANLEKIESDIEGGYIAFSWNGKEVIDGKEGETGIRLGDYYFYEQVDDIYHIYTESIYEDSYYFIHQKYNLKDNTLETDKVELKNAVRKIVEYKDNYFIITKDYNFYVFDKELNYSYSNIDTSDMDFDDIIYFMYDDNITICFYKNVRDDYYYPYNFKSLVGVCGYVNNEFIFFNQLFKKMTHYMFKFACINNEYYYEFEPERGLKFDYNYKKDVINSKADINDRLTYSELKEKCPNKEPIEEKEESKYVEKEYPDFDSLVTPRIKNIFKAYCSRVDSYSCTMRRISGNDYYVVETSYKIVNIIWILQGDKTVETLEPEYIFRYNEKTNSLEYVGYSIDHCYFLILKE